MSKLSRAAKEMYAQFMQEFDFCWTCGFGARVFIGYAPLSGYPRSLENSHILRGPARRHDRRCLTRQCKLCHDLHGGARIIVNKTMEPLPNISLANLLWAKQQFDPDYYDVDYLNSIAIKRVPDPEPLPDVFQTCLRARGRLWPIITPFKQQGRLPS